MKSTTSCMPRVYKQTAGPIETYARPIPPRRRETWRFNYLLALAEAHGDERETRAHQEQRSRLGNRGRRARHAGAVRVDVPGGRRDEVVGDQVADLAAVRVNEVPLE